MTSNDVFVFSKSHQRFLVGIVQASGVCPATRGMIHHGIKEVDANLQSALNLLCQFGSV